MRIQLRTNVTAALTLVAIGHAAIAQPQSAYPNRPIRVVVPFAPGAGTDLSIRTIAPKWSEALGQQVIVDNRVGASGIVGSSIVAKAAPDGYTLLFTATDLAINPALFASMPYDAQKDFAPVGRAVNFPNFLVVNPELPVKSVQDLIALAKAKPGTLGYGSAGNGTPPHISAEMFKQLTNVDLVHVPYKGSAQALTDVIAGQVQLMFVNTLSSIQHVRSGRLRVLGITTAQRAAIAPDVPTIAESGVPGYELITWTGVAAPAGTPRETIVRLNRDLVRTLELPDVREKLLAQGSEVTPSTPEQFAKLIANDTARLGRVARTAKMRLD
jgi:tripartite-type tricarboxylate transporter receptor subunit TctC